MGNMKGVGRVYQQTFIDTYAKVGFAKLSDRKTPIMAADLLNDRVLPFYEENGVVLQRVARNIAAIQSITNMSSISPSRTSTVAAPRPRARKPMASSRGFTRPCSTSSTASPSPSIPA